MAWTQAQHDALEAAIAEGVMKVKYEDKEVTYRSLSDMMKLLNSMKKSLGLIDASKQAIYPTHSRGTA